MAYRCSASGCPLDAVLRQILLENDIVDIDFCELPMHRHVRYLDRVCTAQEAVAIRCSVDPVRALATIWAAKEAAFKFFSQQLALIHFVPRKFGVQLQNLMGNLGASRIEQKVSMHYDGLKAEISLFSM